MAEERVSLGKVQLTAIAGWCVMDDDWMEFLLFRILGPLCILFTAFLLVLIFVIFPIAIMSGWVPPEQRMYKHCIEDGNTDYYCYHMTHSHGGKYD